MPALPRLLDTGGEAVRFVASAEPWPTETELAQAGVRVFDFDSASITNDAGLFRELEVKLAFPYFGHNWDALNDCLRDMAWLPAKAYVLRFHRAERLWSQAPATAGNLVETMQFVRPDCERFGYALHLYFVWGDAA